MLDTTHELLKLRAGQINGCSGCVDSFPELKAASEPDERTFMVSAWRESTYFTLAIRRLSHRGGLRCQKLRAT